MKRNCLFCFFMFYIFFISGCPLTAWAVDLPTLPPIKSLYETECARCHGADRLGGRGPALLPENLQRLKRADALTVIRQGRPATQMPAFAQLSDTQINELVDYIYTPMVPAPTWDEAAIKASYRQDQVFLPEQKPVYSGDPLNLFVVVETGDSHISVVDGDQMAVLKRFPTRFALHGGAKFSPDGRRVYLASRDGWINSYDLYTLQPLAEIRAGINTRNLALSGDGRFILVGNYWPHTLVILDAEDLHLIRVIPVHSATGQSSRVSAVYQAAPRQRFIIALKDVPEAWELDYTQADFPIRRMALTAIMDDFLFDADYRYMLGTDRPQKQGQVLDLNQGQVIAALPLPGMPHLGSGITWDYQGKPVLATPNLEQPQITIIEMNTWQVLKQIPTLGPGFFLRSHENTPYAWADIFTGPHKDTLQMIDKQSLQVVKNLQPAPGKTLSHIEMSRHGDYAWISLAEPLTSGGAILIYDAKTLTEVKRLPMNKPAGKYNVYNKITRSRGTSH